MILSNDNPTKTESKIVDKNDEIISDLLSKEIKKIEDNNKKT